VLQAAAERAGLVTELGQDGVQAIIAKTFAQDHRREPVAVAIDPEPPTCRAAASTVEALMFSLRERGEAALSERAFLDRFAGLSTKQVREVIARLIKLRPTYPAISDDLLLTLGEQL
jgi:hypothetical protein